jgi:hypothetical protein
VLLKENMPILAVMSVITAPIVSVNRHSQRKPVPVTTSTTPSKIHTMMRKNSHTACHSTYRHNRPIWRFCYPVVSNSDKTLFDSPVKQFSGLSEIKKFGERRSDKSGALD